MSFLTWCFALKLLPYTVSVLAVAALGWFAADRAAKAREEQLRFARAGQAARLRKPSLSRWFGGGMSFLTWRFALKLLPYTVSGLAVAALWWFAADRAAKAREITRLKTMVSVREEQLRFARAGQAAQAQYINQVEADHAAKSELIEQLESVPGGDAPLSGYLRRVFDGLRAP